MKKSLIIFGLAIGSLSFFTMVFANAPVAEDPFYDYKTNTIHMYVANLGGGNSAIAGFEYGFDQNYGYVTTMTTLTAPGYVTAVPNFTCEQNYHFRSFVTNAGGLTSGTVLSGDIQVSCADIPESANHAAVVSANAVNETVEKTIDTQTETPAQTEDTQTVTPEAPAVEAPKEEAPAKNNEVVSEATPTEESQVATPTPVEETVTEPVTEVASQEMPALGAAALLSGFIAKPWLWILVGLAVALLVYLKALKRARKWEEEDGGESQEG